MPYVTTTAALLEALSTTATAIVDRGAHTLSQTEENQLVHLLMCAADEIVRLDDLRLATVRRGRQSRKTGG